MLVSASHHHHLRHHHPTGFVLSKEGKSGEEEEISNSSQWVARGEFKNMTYWNHDSLPSADDLILRCFHWFPVSNAVRISMLFFFIFTYLFDLYLQINLDYEETELLFIHSCICKVH